jgi:hypothetical protein
LTGSKLYALTGIFQRLPVSGKGLKPCGFPLGMLGVMKREKIDATLAAGPECADAFQ